MHLADSFKVRYSDDFKTGVRQLLGAEAIWGEAC
jgi:hypothetical protein